MRHVEPAILFAAAAASLSASLTALAPVQVAARREAHAYALRGCGDMLRATRTNVKHVRAQPPWRAVLKEGGAEVRPPPARPKKPREAKRGLELPASSPTRMWAGIYVDSSRRAVYKCSQDESEVRAMKRSISKLPATFRFADARRAGLSKRAIYRLRDTGQLQALGAGLYRRADGEQTADVDLIAVARRAPRATLCLTTALARHELTDAIPAAPRHRLA